MNLPKARGEYNSDYEYPVYVGDFFVYRRSDPDYGLVYEEYEIISKIEGYPSNYSIHAAYENYTIDTQIGDSLENFTVTHLFSLYGDIKEGGYYDNSADWNTETIEIMGASVECWIFHDANDNVWYYDKQYGVLQRVDDPDTANIVVWELIAEYNINDLASFAENDAESYQAGSGGCITRQTHTGISLYGGMNMDQYESDGVVRGNGYENDPYVVECVKFIDTDSYGSAISVNMWQDYLTIRNCVFESGYENQAIILDSAKNVNITNCTFYDDSSKYGIHLKNCEDCSVQDSEISNTKHAGIFLSAQYNDNGPVDYSSNVKIFNNNIHDVKNLGQWGWEGSGIVLQGARDCSISDNKVYKCVNNGFRLEELDHCYNNIIKNNDFCGNTNGGIGKAPGTDSNTYENNKCGEEGTSSSSEQDFGFGEIPGYSPIFLLAISFMAIGILLSKKKILLTNPIDGPD